MCHCSHSVPRFRGLFLRAPLTKARRICGVQRSDSLVSNLTSYNAAYGVLPCFLTFCGFLFRMHRNPGKPPSSPPNPGKNPRNRRRHSPQGDGFLASTLLGGTMSAPFGLPQETMMDNDRKDVQPYPVLIRSGPTRSKCGRRSVRWLAAPARASSSILIRGPNQWLWFWEEGSWRRLRWLYPGRRNTR